MATSSGGLMRIVLRARWPKDAPIGDVGDEIEVDAARGEALLAAEIADLTGRDSGSSEQKKRVSEGKRSKGSRINKK